MRDYSELNISNKKVDNYMFSELRIDINEVVNRLDYQDVSLAKADFVDIQKKILKLVNGSLEDYILAIKLAHKGYLILLSNYRYISNRFLNSKDRAGILMIGSSNIIINRELYDLQSIDITYFATVHIPSDLKKINADYLKCIEYALRITDKKPKTFSRKELISVKEAESCKVITSNVFKEALNVGKENTINKEASILVSLENDYSKKKLNKGNIEITKRIFGNNMSDEEKKIIAARTTLQEIDVQTCVMLYSFAKHYESQMKDNKLFFSTSTLGEFIGKNLRGENGKDILESIERLSSFRIHYSCNNMDNTTVTKLLTGFYGKEINDLKADSIHTITSNYITTQIFEGANGTYFLMEFPLKNMFDKLGQFENNINPKLFSLVNRNQYMIVKIALQLASYSRMKKSPIKLETLMRNLGVLDECYNNSNPSRYLKSFIGKVALASTYINNIQNIKVEDITTSVRGIKNVNIPIIQISSQLC